MLKNKKTRIVTILILSFVMLFGAIFGFYVSDYYRADDIALDATFSDSTVTVIQKNNDCVVFTPEEPERGLVFYPGGKVEYTAYAPLMKALAAEGFFCVLVKMPFNLAVLDINAAEGIQEQYPDIESWYIGGHSLGGSMAAAYLADHAEEYDGLILLGSYAATDLSDAEIDVLSVYGSEDQVLDRENYGEYRRNLPEDFRELVIDGGCHAGFGMYGPQDGDGVPAITAQEQIEITADAITEMVGA